MKIDCHVHSSLSDGNATNGEIAEIALNRGVDFLVITDHDLINRTGSKLLKEKGINTCEGIELTIHDSILDKKLHFVCYSDRFSKSVSEGIRSIISSKLDELQKIIVTLKNIGFQIDSHEFEKAYYSNKIYLADFGLAFLSVYIYQSEYNLMLIKMLEGKEISRKSFLKKYLNEGYGIESNESMRLLEVLSADENIVVSLAHPNFKLNTRNLEETIKRYKDIGINAVEINSKSRFDWVNLIIEYHKKYDYLLTFGSDCHFIGWPQEKHGELGDMNPFLEESMIRENHRRFLDILR